MQLQKLLCAKNQNHVKLQYLFESRTTEKHQTAVRNISDSSVLECQELSTRNILVFLHNKEFLSWRTWGSLYRSTVFGLLQISSELGFMRPSIKFVTHFRCSPEKYFFWRSGHPEITAYSISIRQFSLFMPESQYYCLFLDYFVHLNQVFWQWSLWPCGELSSTGVCCCVLCKRLNYSDWPSRACATAPPQNKVRKAIYINCFG